MPGSFSSYQNITIFSGNIDVTVLKCEGKKSPSRLKSLLGWKLGVKCCIDELLKKKVYVAEASKVYHKSKSDPRPWLYRSAAKCSVS
jgi:hypothetical protein